MTQEFLKDSGTRKCSDILTLGVSVTSPRKNHAILIKLSYLQEAMRTYERNLQWCTTPLRTPLFYSSWRKPGPLTRRILNTPSKQRQSRSLAYNSILERKTRLNTLTSLSPPWYTGVTPTKNGAFSSPPPSLAEL
ncbi:hypothetical protein ACFX2F_017753 [Malus domestica]